MYSRSAPRQLIWRVFSGCGAGQAKAAKRLKTFKQSGSEAGCCKALISPNLGRRRRTRYHAQLVLPGEAAAGGSRRQVLRLGYLGRLCWSSRAGILARPGRTTRVPGVPPQIDKEGGGYSSQQLPGLAHTSCFFSHDAHMATIQSAAEIAPLLERLKGKKIATFQVLGVNSLKTVSPLPEALVGEAVTEVDVVERIINMHTTGHRISFDLQRTGRVVMLESAEPYRHAAAGSRPTVRLLMADGSGVDLTEPAKTKRITVTIVTRSD